MSKADNTRRHIIEKSAELFNVHGISGTSMTMIMEAAGLKKGGIYNHFSTKEELAIASFWYAYGLLREGYIRSFAQERSAAQKLLAFVRTYKGFVERPPIPGGCPIQNFAIESDDAHPTIAREVRKALDEWLETLEKLFRWAAEEQNIALDPRQEARFMIASIEGAIMLARIRKEGELLSQTADSLLAYLERLLNLSPTERPSR